MNNNPKKSKALIITLIILIILILGLFLAYKNRDAFGVKTSSFITKMFSPIITNEDPKELEVIVQAGEDLKKGDEVKMLNENVAIKSTNQNETFGVAYEDISSGDLGKILKIKKQNENNFWKSIQKYTYQILNIEGPDTGEPVEPDPFIIDTSYVCSDGKDNDGDGTIDSLDANCHTDGDLNKEYIPTHYSESTNPSFEQIDLNTLPSVSMTLDDKDASVSSVTVDEERAVTIMWTSKNTKNCELRGDLSNSGNDVTSGTSGRFYTKTITKSEVYSVVCESSIDSSVVSDTAFIYKTNPNGGGVDLSTLPSVSMTLDDKDASVSSVTVDEERAVTIMWTSKNTKNCELRGDLSNSGNDVTSGTSGRFYTKPITKSEVYSVICESNIDSSVASDTAFIYKTIGKLGPNGECLNGATNPPYCSIWEEGDSDLKAGSITPIVAVVNKETNLYSNILNEGNKAINKTFSSFFTIMYDYEKNAPAGIKTIKEENPNKIIHTESVVTPITGAKTSTKISIPYKFSMEGEYTVRVCADKINTSDTGIIKESNENNNCGPWTTITVNKSGNIPNSGYACSNGATNYPECNIMPGGCQNGATNPPDCTVNTNGSCLNSATNPPDCSTWVKKENIITNKCLLVEQNPLEFTEAEEAKISELLRKYYIIAPTLKNEDDIVSIYKELENYKLLIENVEDLTQKCYAQTKTTEEGGKYTGPTTRAGNPWYKYDTKPSYIYGDKPPLKYLNKTVDENNSKDIFYNFYKCYIESRSKTGGRSTMTPKDYQDMCEPLEDRIIYDYEKILNIW